jgi:hypothetical protein
MFDYDEFEEKAGHELTMVQGLLAGVSTYYCENCGALVRVGGPYSEMLLFHVPRGSLSTESQCVKAGSAAGNVHTKETLQEKLAKLEREDYEKLKRSAEA